VHQSSCVSALLLQVPFVDVRIRCVGNTHHAANNRDVIDVMYELSWKKKIVNNYEFLRRK
jgi:hypothetical protein